MKKTFLITALIALVVFTSCNKNKIDGVYNPKEKIDKIYWSNDDISTGHGKTND